MGMFDSVGYRFEPETKPAIEDWERQRECLHNDPDLFDVDADKRAHAEAERICRKCPVKQQCTRDRMVNPAMAGAAGVYGGMIFTSFAGEAPYSVEDYHASHKVGSAFRKPHRKSQQTFEPGWTEERQCASFEIGCDQRFTVTVSNHTKKFHDVACRRRYYQVVGREEKDDVA